MRINLKATVMEPGDWRMREGRLAYEAAVFAHDRGILGLGFDRGESLDFIMANEGYFADNHRRRQQLSSTGTITTLLFVAALIGSFAWRWWFFLICVIVGFVVIAAKMKIGAKNCSQIIIDEGLKNQELYDMILEQGRWHFISPYTLEEIQKMYEARDPAEDRETEDRTTRVITAKI